MRILSDIAVALLELLVARLADLLEVLLELRADAEVPRAVHATGGHPTAQQGANTALARAAQLLRLLFTRQAPRAVAARGAVRPDRRVRRGLAEREGADDILVVGDDQLRHGARDGLDRRGEQLPGLVAADYPVGDALGEPVEHPTLALDSSDDQLQGEQREDRQEVEHVVDSGAREAGLELGPVADEAHRDDGVGHGGADVRAHDDWDARLDGDLVGAHEAHDD
mmetsp:Transcript_78341/g.175179  ORF Transcript_78341/g.175179 Transcript_78341/m.175179 type:complete len:225 (+) Transcript_78341:1060-1734(+)